MWWSPTLCEWRVTLPQSIPLSKIRSFIRLWSASHARCAGQHYAAHPLGTWNLRDRGCLGSLAGCYRLVPSRLLRPVLADTVCPVIVDRWVNKRDTGALWPLVPLFRQVFEKVQLDRLVIVRCMGILKDLTIAHHNPTSFMLLSLL